MILSVLVSGKDRPLMHYRDLATSLCHKFKLPDLTTPTQVRKAGATLAVDQGSDKATIEKFAIYTMHSSSMSEKYYRGRSRT